MSEALVSRMRISSVVGIDEITGGVVVDQRRADSTDHSPEILVRRTGRVVDQFDHRTQDSGNISWVVETEDGSFFVKTAGTLGPAPAGAPVPYFDHAQLRNVIETPAGSE